MFKGYIILCIFISSYFSTSTTYATSNFTSKDEFLEKEFPNGHDFTKIAENAEYRYGHVLVRFFLKNDSKKLNISDKKKFIKSLGGATLRQNYLKPYGLALVKLPPNQTVEDALQLYNSRDDILYAEPDYKIKLLSAFPNDTYFNSQWSLYNSGRATYVRALEYDVSGTSGACIDALEAWRIMDASDFVVAVIDSGVDYNHPDLSDNMWRNPIEEPNDANNDGYPGIGGYDDDGDDLIDEDSQGNSRYLEDEETPNPSWTNDIPNDDDENRHNNENLII